MCEICDMMDKYAKAQKDLAFRIGQHGHALVMGNTDEAATAQTSAVNALYSVFAIQKQLFSVAERLEQGESLEKILRGSRPH